MNALVKKEIRLLLPVWLAVLALGVVLPWIGSDQRAAMMLAPIFSFFGMILLAVDSFGREFSLGTFSTLMAQPMERRQVWRTKIAVLASAAALIFAAYFASSELRLHRVYDSNSWVLWSAVPDALAEFFHQAMFASVAVWFVALAGGLWTTILLRQLSAAFWIAFLAPLGIALAVILCLPEKYGDNGHFVIPLLYLLAGVYTVAGYWLAHRLFHRAQDVAWTGGVISFSKWRYFDAGRQSAASVGRQPRPLAALLKKEFQLHSISLFCVGSLLLLHILVILMRKFYGSHLESASFFNALSNLFWTLWMVMPLIIGCTTVAEERKLGVADGQFCLPVSRQTQFLVKFIPVLIFGTLLGGVMPILLETAAVGLGAPAESFRQVSQIGNEYGSGLLRFQISVVLFAAGLSWFSFFASTLAQNFLQALSVSVVGIVGCSLVGSLVSPLFEKHISILGILPWPSLLPILIGVPTALITFQWLVYRNFNRFAEGWRLWRRNLLGILGAILFVFVSSAMLYNRVWEVFEPAEPAHGPAKFTKANLPVLQCDRYRDVQVRLVDGRIWCDSLGYPFMFEHDYQPNRWKRIWWMLTDPRPKSDGPRQFIAGSNWVSAATRHIVFRNWNQSPDGLVQAEGYLDTIGIQSNGTLWISRRAVPKEWTGSEMTQVGTETNWRQVIYAYPTYLLLKNDGTLWRWGTNRLDWGTWNTNWPTVRNCPLRQVGTNSDWQEISNSKNAAVNARKTDGSAWYVGVDDRTGLDELTREKNYDPSSFQPDTWAENSTAKVGTNGTLWIASRHLVEGGGYENQGSWQGTGYLPVGNETNWVAASRDWPLIALKADGTLWKWNSPTNSTTEIAQNPPKRLGIHADWIGLVPTWDGVVTLAADGSLWFWPREDHSDSALFKFPKQPQFLGNVFGTGQ